MPSEVSQGASNVGLFGWLEQETDERARAGGDTKPWHAIATDLRMATVWPIIGDWPQDTAILFLRLAMALAENDLSAELANQSEVASPVHRMGHTARALIAELNGDPEMADRLLGASIGVLVGLLETLANGAERHAMLLETLLRRLAPGVTRNVSHDRKKLTYRGAIASMLADLRRKGIDLKPSNQHRLVATLTNVVFGGGEVTAEAEERRWARQKADTRA